MRKIAGGNGTYRRAGGAATGSGMNFQAATTAIANICMARGQPLLWLAGLVDDTPIAVEAETGGSGDDIRLFLKDTRTVEVQVKKGLNKGAKLWTSLLKLAAAITKGDVDFGVLVVSSTSSSTITNNLANDIVRIGDGRTDGLSSIGAMLSAKLAAAGINGRVACMHLRIQTVHALAADQAGVLAARAELAHVCASAAQIGLAWNVIYTDATTLIEQRGRRDVAAVLCLLLAARINLNASTAAAPIQLLAKLARWTFETNSAFSIVGVNKPLSIDHAWIPIIAVVREESVNEDANFEEALRRYQAWETRSVSRHAREVNPETLGRFVTRTVLVAGPGMGKTTLLKRLARRYSEDSIPVLLVRLSAVASRMRIGATFEEAIFNLGLDGSNIDSTSAQLTRFVNWTLLCDGLDECGALQEDVAAGVARFAAGHAHCRILVTTRPIGYRSTQFTEWRHYDVPALDTSAVRTNAVRLIHAITTPGSELHQDVLARCQGEFKDRSIAEIVGRTPLLLGLAVAIIIRGKSLGATRERLFEQIFELIDEVPNARIPEPPAPAALLRRFLEILGWQITSRPLDAIKDTLDRCATNLAADTGARPIAAAADAERYLRYWEDVGIIERVGYGNQQTLTFIHKSFGEFAAARYLRAMPPVDQAEAAANILDAPPWTEVLRFAGLMGMADIFATQILAGPDVFFAKRIVRAVELMAEASPPPARNLRARIINGSFTIITGERRQQAFHVGTPLVAAARRFPNEIGPVAGRHLATKQSWTRLIAWACVVAAGTKHYSLETLIETLRESVEAAHFDLRTSYGGGIVYDDGLNLIESFVLDACEEIIERASVESADTLVAEILNHDKLGRVGFVFKATEFLEVKGRKHLIKRLNGMDSSLFTINNEYEAAWRTMYYGIFDALDVPDEQPSRDASCPQTLLHLSAFLWACKMMETPANDVWAWSQPYNQEALREAFHGFIAACSLDWTRLREDCLHARYYLTTEAGATNIFLTEITTQVDPPPIDWTRARSLGLDAGLLEATVAHPSQWVRLIAANLLLALLDPTALEAAVRRLLVSGRNEILFVVGAMVLKLGREHALSLMLWRLAQPLVPGCEHLFDALTSLSPPWSSEIEVLIRVGLLSIDVDIAVAAAKLADNAAEPVRPELVSVLKHAYEHWLVHEEPYPQGGGVVPTSPRFNLIEALHKLRGTSYEEIKKYLADARSDVRDKGAVLLVERLQQPEGERLQFFYEVDRDAVLRRMLGTVLKENLPLAPNELTAAETLLISKHEEVRFGAMALLTDQYLDRDRILIHAIRLTRDSLQQVRDQAFALIDKFPV